MGTSRSHHDGRRSEPPRIGRSSLNGECPRFLSPPLFDFSPQLSREVFVDRLARANGHEANGVAGSVGGIDDPKAAHAKLPESAQLAAQRLPAFRIDGNRANRGFDRSFQIGMERADDLRHMRRDDGLKGLHAVRRFLAGAIGSPNTSSNERPFLPVR